MHDTAAAAPVPPAQPPIQNLDQRAAAALMRRSVRTLERYRQTGHGPAWKRLGPRSIVYDRMAILDWLRSGDRKTP